MTKLPTPALAACLLALLPAAGAAQSVGAPLPGRFEQHREPRPTVPGLSPAEARDWNASLGRVAEILAANSAAHSPPEGVCTRLRSFVNQGVLGPRAVDHVSVEIPILYGREGCSEMSNDAVRVGLNDPLDLLQRDGTINPNYTHDAEGAFLVLERTDERIARRPVYRVDGMRVMLLTRGSEPLTIPVTRERYLRHRIAEAEQAHAEVQTIPTEPMISVERWLREDRPRLVAEQQEMLRSMEAQLPAEQLERMKENFARFLEQTESALRQAEARQPDAGAMAAEAAEVTGGELARLRAELAGLSPAERRAPACMDFESSPGWLGECHDHNRVVSLNPRYFDPSLPKSAVQLIVVTSRAGTSSRENPAHAVQRHRIFETLDYDALAEVLH